MRVRCLRMRLLAVCLVILLFLICSCGNSPQSTPPPPPAAQPLEYAYVLNIIGGSGQISGFKLDSAGKLTEIQGSPFKIPWPGVPWFLMSDSQSKFLLIRGYDSIWYEENFDALAPVGITASHALTFASVRLTGLPRLPAGPPILDPRGRFLFGRDPVFATGIYVYSITPDLAFPEIDASPFQFGTWNNYAAPAGIDPAGKFVFAFEPLTDAYMLSTLQISNTGALARIASLSVSDGGAVIVHPSGRFLYLTTGYYWGYAVRVFQLDSSGALTPASQVNFANNKYLESLMLHPSGKFAFAYGCDNSQVCSIDTLLVDSTTGAMNPIPAYSRSVPMFRGGPALDSAGVRVFGVSGDLDCRASGVLTVLRVSTQGQLLRVGITAPTPPCPIDVVVSQ